MLSKVSKIPELDQRKYRRRTGPGLRCIDDPKEFSNFECWPHHIPLSPLLHSRLPEHLPERLWNPWIRNSQKWEKKDVETLPVDQTSNLVHYGGTGSDRYSTESVTLKKVSWRRSFYVRGNDGKTIQTDWKASKNSAGQNVEYWECLSQKCCLLFNSRYSA